MLWLKILFLTKSIKTVFHDFQDSSCSWLPLMNAKMRLQYDTIKISK